MVVIVLSHLQYVICACVLWCSLLAFPAFQDLAWLKACQTEYHLARVFIQLVHFNQRLLMILWFFILFVNPVFLYVSQCWIYLSKPYVSLAAGSVSQLMAVCSIVVLQCFRSTAWSCSVTEQIVLPANASDISWQSVLFISGRQCKLVKSQPSITSLVVTPWTRKSYQKFFFIFIAQSKSNVLRTNLHCTV